MKNAWYQHFFYRKQVLKTTWKLRLCILLVVLAVVVVPHRFWARAIGRSLVCKEQIAPSDALLLENFDISYTVFRYAAILQKEGVASRAFVPTVAGKDPGVPSAVARQFVEVMAHEAGLRQFELIPYREKEPISLNTARQIRDHLNKEGIKSVVVLAPGFRSRRSEMVYEAVLAPEGIRVGCVPILGDDTVGSWTSSWHGIQNVFEQFLKLQYYRFDVLL